MYIHLKNTNQILVFEFWFTWNKEIPDGNTNEDYSNMGIQASLGKYLTRYAIYILYLNWLAMYQVQMKTMDDSLYIYIITENEFVLFYW